MRQLTVYLDNEFDKGVSQLYYTQNILKQHNASINGPGNYWPVLNALPTKFMLPSRITPKRCPFHGHDSVEADICMQYNSIQVVPLHDFFRSATDKVRTEQKKKLSAEYNKISPSSCFRSSSASVSPKGDQRHHQEHTSINSRRFELKTATRQRNTFLITSGAEPFVSHFVSNRIELNSVLHCLQRRARLNVIVSKLCCVEILRSVIKRFFFSPPIYYRLQLMLGLPLIPKRNSYRLLRMC